MTEFVAVDASSPPGGENFFTIGVAVEISDVETFRSYYFDVVEEFCEEYSLELPFPVLKSKFVVDNLPSYQIRDGMGDLFTDLVENPGISRIHVSVGWYNEEVELEYNGKELSGIEFAANHLNQYFPVVTLWRYHREHDCVPDIAIIDNVQGHITKAWKYVGNEFDIRMIPHGDLTYPSLSTADILAYNLGRRMPSDQPFLNYPEIAQEILIRNRSWDTQPYILGDVANERYTDHIVPALPYTIQAEAHHPHPVLFLHDTVLSGEGNEIIPQTDFHAFARKWAFENEGSVVALQPNRLPTIVRSGDSIIHTKGTDSSQAELFQELHPTKDIEVLDSEDLYSLVATSED